MGAGTEADGHQQAPNQREKCLARPPPAPPPPSALTTRVAILRQESRERWHGGYSREKRRDVECPSDWGLPSTSQGALATSPTGGERAPEARVETCVGIGRQLKQRRLLCTRHARETTPPGSSTGDARHGTGHRHVRITPAAFLQWPLLVMHR